MKKHWEKMLLASIIAVLVIFYFGKREEINNILDTSNAKIEIIEKTYNFDEIKLKDTLNHIFLIKNISSKDLIISNVHSNCGCTITSFSKNAVKENETAKISVKFIPIKKGMQEKSVVVEANTSPPFTVLKLKGLVK